jgi:hypothetical protein
MVFQNIMMGAAGQGGGYDIDQSIRFNDDDSSYLTDTLGTATDANRWTYSVWVKRSNLTGAYMSLINASSALTDTGFLAMNFHIDNTLYVTGWNTRWRQTSQVFRDISAWYHIVLAVDTDQGTANDRIKLYVNGEQVTALSVTTNPSSGANLGINTAGPHEIGRDYGAIRYFDGYQSEINLIDGQQLTPTDFGEFNDDGVWIPKAYAGTYGTNGFYITGADSAALGTDYSGNGNDFTSSGLAAADQMSDTPTDNYPVFSPINKSTNITLSDGNLLASSSGSGDTFPVMATICPESSKWYAEFEMVEADGIDYVGIGNSSETARIAGATFTNVVVGLSAGYQNGVSYRNDNGNISTGGSTSAYGNTFTTNDIIGVALDADTGSVWFSKNGTFQNSGNPAAGTGAAVTGLTGPFCFSMSIYNTDDIRANFGQSAFTYTPPTGFSVLSTANLPAPTITDGSQYFHTQLYTGTGSSGLAITNDANFGDFQPDMLLLAPRSNGDNHVMWDVARGVTSRLKTNSTAAQDTDGTALLTFEADGFDLDTTDPNFNGSARTYVAWQWHTQGGAGSSNTAGSINTTTTSVNTTAGISISTFEGNGTAGATIGHGMGVKPSWIVIKNRDGTEQWIVYHATQGATKYGLLNSSDGFASSSGAWNNVEPTSTLITLGGGGFGTNVSGNSMVCYAFAEIDGFSKFGSYTGNGNADGPLVYTGFKPAFVILKRTNGASQWFTLDTARNAYNVMNLELRINQTNAESSTDAIDMVSNGFKIRHNSAVISINDSGSPFAFMAFAENPFGGADVAPATAR